MQDGRILEGKIAQLSAVNEKASEVHQAKARLIMVVDDGLRYVYVPEYMIRRNQIPEATPESMQIFKTKIRPSQDGTKLTVLGDYDTNVKFDTFGRRLLPLQGGASFASQVITELTPRYIRVQGLHLNNNPLIWDMRIATASLPREQLTPILMNQIDREDINDRKKLVRFYTDANLLEKAADELFSILEDWKDDAEVRQDLTAVYRRLEQMRYQNRLNEMELRWNAGQYGLVLHYLRALEKDEKLPEQLFMSVRRMIQRYSDFQRNAEAMSAQIDAMYEKLPETEKDDRLPPILEEIKSGLSLNTIGRLDAFKMAAPDKAFSDTEKLAIAMTGWYAGSAVSNRRLTIAASLPEARELVRKYLLTGEHDALERKDILEKLRKLEASTPEMIAGILANMKPPKETTEETDEEKPGFYELEIPNPLHEPEGVIRYNVQLPPGYDPLRGDRYPVLVTLNGLTQSPEMQIDFWAGSWRGRERTGHATRHGYIVVAPDWNPQVGKRLEYDFSAFPHAAVLFTLKDAFRRFNIDTDKVFITGHGVGGTAAWDIALAHPDLWAGAIPFHGVASKYIQAYQPNVGHVPMYFVDGELNGLGQTRNFDMNAAVFNQYLPRQAAPYDVTVVRFIGRGQESFSDEIINVFEWMNRRTRNFTPLSFEAYSMRAWDDFFWWVELPMLDKQSPDNVTDPIIWPEKGIPKKKITVRSTIMKQANVNRLNVTVTPRMDDILVFLTPDMLDFNAKISVEVNGRPYHPPDGYVEKDIAVMLEDARTRSDRLHPFWVCLKRRR